MANRKKHKKNNSYLIFAFLLIIAAIVLIILVANILGDNTSNDISHDNSSIVSQVVSAESVQSSEDIISKDESIPAETSQSYDDYIGVEYSIDINNWGKYIDPSNSADYLILVNKTNSLESNYVPKDLSSVTYTRKDGRATQRMVDTAEKSLQAFMLEAAKFGVTNVSVTSAYRSYAYQKSLFNGYVNQRLSKYSSREECEKYVETFSARPGTSEHQTGLSCDMHNLSAAHISFANTKEAKWLAQNAHRFGFILRYPENKTEITGYQYEPWHFRFVGRTAATEIYQKGICLEEYTALHQN